MGRLWLHILPWEARGQFNPWTSRADEATVSSWPPHPTGWICWATHQPAPKALDFTTNSSKAKSVTYFLVFKHCTKNCWCVSQPRQLNQHQVKFPKLPQSHHILGIAYEIDTLHVPTSHLAPYKVWHSPMATFQHTPPALLHVHRFGILLYWAVGGRLCKQPSSLWSRLGCNSKRSCAINVSWQEKHCTACCSSCHTSLSSLVPLSGPVTHAREESKSKAVLKPSCSSSLFIHCAEWYSEKFH